MNLNERIQQIENLRAELVQGGSRESVDRLHESGRLTARERVMRLLDPGTFSEIELFLKPSFTGFDIDRRTRPGDGLVAGYGRIHGRPVCVWSQDITAADGRMGILQAARIVTIIERALKARIPCIGMFDSRGVRVEDFLTNPSNCSYDRIAWLMTRMSGVAPQISLILGPCVGPAAICAQLADFVFMAKGASHSSLSGSDEIDPEKTGAAKNHYKLSGCCDVLASDDAECLDKARDLMSFLPDKMHRQDSRNTDSDDIRRETPELLDLVPEDGKHAYQVQKVIETIADNRHFFEVKAGWAPNLVVGFARFGGTTCGIIANNPANKGGCLDVDSADKLARMVRFCNAFRIPVIYLADTPAFLPSIEQERKGIIRHGAKAIFANSMATVPQIQIYLRKCYGGGTLAMPGNTLGGDHAFGWPTTELLLMNPQGAVSIIHRKEIAAADDPKAELHRKMEEFRNATATENIWEIKRVQDFIHPKDTRVKIIEMLTLLEGKTEEAYFNRHDNMPL